MITHEEARQIILGTGEQQTITLDVLLKKLKEYQGGKMMFLSLEEYNKMLAYITEQQAKDKVHEGLVRDVKRYFELIWIFKNTMWACEEDSKPYLDEYTLLKDKLSKVGKEK